MTDTPLESVKSITPSPLGRALIYGLCGVAVGVALGYGIAKILEEERFGRYRAEDQDQANEMTWVEPGPVEVAEDQANEMTWVEPGPVEVAEVEAEPSETD